jgi:hypothetical protein
MWRSRKLWIAVLAVPLLLIAADSLYWFIAKRNLDDGFAAWVAQARADGWTITTGGKPQAAGWPAAATLTVPVVKLQGGDRDILGGLTWTAERLVLRVSLLRPRILLVEPQGEQQLRLSGNPEMAFTAGHMQAALPLAAEAWPRFADIGLTDLRVAGDLATVGDLRAHLDFAPEATASQPAIGLTLQTERVGLPPGPARALGPFIASLAIEGDISGPVPPGNIVTEQAKAWRDARGSLNIRHLALLWGSLDLTAHATLTLDDQLQVAGDGSAKATGYGEALDALASHGVISRSGATAAKAVLSLLASNPENGGPPSVDVPLTLKYRTLSMRQVPLVRLPELDWP